MERSDLDSRYIPIPPQEAQVRGVQLKGYRASGHAPPPQNRPMITKVAFDHTYLLTPVNRPACAVLWTSGAALSPLHAAHYSSYATKHNCCRNQVPSNITVVPAHTVQPYLEDDACMQQRLGQDTWPDCTGVTVGVSYMCCMYSPNSAQVLMCSILRRWCVENGVL